MQKTKYSWFILISILITLFIIDLSIGSAEISVLKGATAIFKGETSVEGDILINFRLTKALTCVLAGACLALAGLQMQTLFRNPLAGPDVLGLSSGASLAVSLLFLSNVTFVMNQSSASAWTVALAASGGCMAVFLIMISVARHLRDNVSLLLIGLMVGAVASSVVSVLQYLSKSDDLQTYIIWTFGTLSALNWEEIGVLGLMAAVGILIAVLNVKSLNAWLMGEHYARSIGINISRSRMLAILSGGILTGVVTAFCGPIAFVGLAVPHLVKLVVRTNDHRKLLPAVCLGGASLLLFCDILAQAPDSVILPVNAITALIGAPVVIWVVLKHKSVTV